jgi:hypothetical protein
MALSGNGVPRFANYFQDHIVLQRAPQKALVWGYEDSNQLTTLRINNQMYSTISRVESINDLGENIFGQ